MTLKKIASKLQKFAAAPELYLVNLDEDEQRVVRQGFVDFLDFFKHNAPEAKRLAKEEDNLSLYRLLDDTTKMLVYTGIPKSIPKLEGYMKLWESKGYDKIAEALKVRREEADIIPIQEEEPEDLTSYITYEGEDEPLETQRSLIARLQLFTDIFVKSAEG